MQYKNHYCSTEIFWKLWRYSHFYQWIHLNTYDWICFPYSFHLLFDNSQRIVCMDKNNTAKESTKWTHISHIFWYRVIISYFLFFICNVEFSFSDQQKKEPLFACRTNDFVVMVFKYLKLMIKSNLGWLACDKCASADERMFCTSNAILHCETVHDKQSFCMFLFWQKSQLKIVEIMSVTPTDSQRADFEKDLQ